MGNASVVRFWAGGGESGSREAGNTEPTTGTGHFYLSLNEGTLGTFLIAVLQHIQ